jgi:hypothetical protein
MYVKQKNTKFSLIEKSNFYIKIISQIHKAYIFN